MSVPPFTRSREGLAARICFATLVIATTWIGQEFLEGGAPSFWYGRYAFGIPIYYPLFALLLLLLLPYLRGTKKVSAPVLLKARGMWRWVGAAWLALIVSILYAILTQAPEPFADWRNLVIMGATTAVSIRWLASRKWRAHTILDLGIGYGLLAWFLLGRWVSGSGARLFDQLTPVFYWPWLFMLLFSSLVAAAAWLAGLGDMSPLRRAGVIAAATGSSLVIVLSFRRSFWIAWALGIILVVSYAVRRKELSARKVLVLAAGLVLIILSAITAFGPAAFSERLESFSLSSESNYGATNQDHVNDLVEALGVIGENPVTGLGLGVYYDTPLLAQWKEESFEVHNVILQVWLKFGLVGLVAYLGFHWSWIRASARVQHQSRAISASHRAVGIYIIAQFANTMSQTWVYGRFQVAIHMGVLLACLLAVPQYPRSVEALKWDAASASPLPG